MVNQCDGCMQRAPLRDHLHVDENGRAFMACEREKYEDRVTCLSCGTTRDRTEQCCGH